MKYTLPISIVIGIFVLVIILYGLSVRESFTPVSSDVDKIVKYISSLTTLDHSAYVKFLKDNKLAANEYNNRDVYMGLIILKKLGLLTNANITKLLQ